MRIRTPLLSCVALVLVTTTGFGQESLYGNCPYHDSNGDWWCGAWMYGDVNLPGDRSVYNLLLIDKRDTGTLTNIGSIAYNVVIEQGIRLGVRGQGEPRCDYKYRPTRQQLLLVEAMGPRHQREPERSAAENTLWCLHCADPHHGRLQETYMLNILRVCGCI
jgi:hypothetical protein